MRIGTPLTKNALRVMLLGCGELGKEVIIALQRLGVEVIGVDRYENAPGHQVAHRTYVIDMTDAAALRQLVEHVRPHIIVPEIEAIATEELERIEAEGLSEVIPNAKAARLTMNREGIRRLAAEELGLATSKFAFISSLEELEAAIEKTGLPAIIKPVMSSSGKGQSEITSKADCAKAFEYAKEGARVRGAKMIVEEKIDFDYEITLLTVRAKNANGQIDTHFCAPIGHRQQNGDYVESWQPQPMTATALGNATHIAKKITTALGGRGIFGVELFVKGDDVWFSEVSPRPHDTGLVTLATQRLNEFELHARAILGLPVSTRLESPGASAVIYGEYNEPAISFDDVDKALSIEGTDIRLFGKPESFERRRMGVAVATGDNVDEARARADDAANCVKPVSHLLD
jgi:phosphoribosylglycinamide formyltransferase 2